MPTEVFEDSQEIEIGLLEAELPSSAADSSYPYPRLKTVGRHEVRAFRTVLLENDTLRLTVLPDLGGRLISVLDKRTNTEIVPQPSRFSAVPGGPRGVTLPWGVEFYTQGMERRNALGYTAFAAELAPEQDLPGGVWIADSVDGTGLSCHVRYTLEPDRPEFRIEAKIFNRTYTDVGYNGAFAFHVLGGVATEDGHSLTYYSADRNSGLWIDTSESFFDGISLDQDLVLARFAASRTLAPRQLDSFSVRVVPFSGVGEPGAANGEAAASLGDGTIRVQTNRTRMGHKLLVLAQDGQTLEAMVDLYPERVLEIPFSDLPSEPRELVLLSPSKQEVLRVPASSRRQSVPSPSSSQAVFSVKYGVETSVEALERMTFDVASRHAAHALLARNALSEKEYLAAENHLEQSLLYNAEDHLAWWTKAMAARLREGPGGERPELLNAHYLAPLEPALRAEAFLSQNQEMGKEPSPLLAALADHPESFVEVAALLVDLGLNDQATRWIDEALRHVDLVMLRYLQAFCYLRGSRMHVEAGECVAAAGRLGFSPPLPWRDIEWEAIAALHAKFQDDALLDRYLALKSR